MSLNLLDRSVNTYTVCENYNCLAITVHEIQATETRTDKQTSCFSKRVPFLPLRYETQIKMFGFLVIEAGSFFTNYIFCIFNQFGYVLRCHKKVPDLFLRDSSLIAACNSALLYSCLAENEYFSRRFVFLYR